MVTMVMTDILDRSVYKFIQRLPARKPKSFVARGLQPERRYEIHFSGIARWYQHRGSVTTTTLEEDANRMNFCVVHGDRPERLAARISIHGS